jgi:hypothetical protein
MDMPLAALGVAALAYGWIRAILWAVNEDRRNGREPEWMRILDAELERDLKTYLHPSRMAQDEEEGAA